MIKILDVTASGGVCATSLMMLWLALGQALTGGLRTTSQPGLLSGFDAAFIFVMTLAAIYVSARLFYKAFSK